MLAGELVSGSVGVYNDGGWILVPKVGVETTIRGSEIVSLKSL